MSSTATGPGSARSSASGRTSTPSCRSPPTISRDRDMAQIERRVEADEMEPGQDEHPPLASGIADAAAAQLLIFDDLPEDERPGPNDRGLLVGIVWGGATMVELEQVVDGGDLSVRRLFDLPESTHPKRSEEHTSELQSPCNLVC